MMHHFAAMHSEIRLLYTEISELTKKTLQQDLKLERMEHKHTLEMLGATTKIEELEREVASLKDREQAWKAELDQHKETTTASKKEEKEQFERLTNQIEEQKSWAEVVRNKKPKEQHEHQQDIAKEVQSILSKEKDRLKRANNLTLRGVPEHEKESSTQLRQTVQTTLQEKFDQPGLEILMARRVRKANERGKSRLVIFSIEQGCKQSLLTTKLQCLKGSTLFLDDDRTPKQKEEYGKMLEACWNQRQSNKRTHPPSDK